MYDRAAESLNVPLRRTMLITDANVTKGDSPADLFGAHEELAQAPPVAAGDHNGETSAHPLSAFAQGEDTEL